MEIHVIDRRFIVPKIEISCATIGNFDGIHLGHKKLIEETNIKGFKRVVITFDTLTKDSKQILSNEDKYKMIESYGVDHLIVLDYDYFSSFFYNEFIKMLKKMKIKMVVVGKDFRFGFKQEGDIIDLENNFEVKIVDDVKMDNQKVSSSIIRDYLSKGDVLNANKLLGYNYSVKGLVVHGNQIGRTLGFPTANLDCNNFILKTGVYKTNVIVNGILYKSMTNIGINPTINEQVNIKIESNIIDFNDDIYGKEIEVIFLDRLRDEKKFNSKEELLQALQENLNSCK